MRARTTTGPRAVGNSLTHRVALDPGSSLPRIKCGVARPGHAVLVSRASAASATERAKRDPGPSGRSAQHNIGSHRGRYAVAAAASPRVIELMQDRGEGVGLLSDPAAVGRGVGSAGAVAVVALHHHIATRATLASICA